jgi:signal transduction histidine kinase
MRKSSNTPSKTDDLNWLSGGGEMGALIRSMDWSKTPLGPPQDWPQSLRTSVSLCLSSTFPILVAWGHDDIQIYNDAYRPICGDLHPLSMGAPFKEVWASALPVVGDAFDRAHKGEGTYIRDQRMFLDRYGYLEETFMTFSFSPIRDESGEVGGIFHPISEATPSVLNARRTQCLRDLAAAIADARTIGDVGRELEAQFQHMALDLPFILLYQLDPGSGMLQLRGSAGLEAHPELAPLLAGMDDLCWPFARTAQLRIAQQVDGLRAAFRANAVGPYANAPDSALVFPITLAGQQEPYGFVVAGVSAARELDADYIHFYELFAAAVTTAVSNVVAYEKEQQRAEELAQLDRAKTAFFSNVSHEFRTPLTLILGPLDDALSDQVAPLPLLQRQRIEVTHRNAMRLLKLVNSMLDFSRIEAGRIQANYVPLDLKRLTADLAGVFESAMEKGGLAYRVDLQDLGEPVYVDRDMWEKIVLNLLSNAFKFTLHGSVTVILARHEGMARLSVRDSGIGIPESELPRVFERFYRIEGTLGRSYEGTGIGLALIQELVRLHGGTISAHSVSGEGTRFDVDIPLGNAHLPREAISCAPHGEAKASRDSAGRAGAAFVEEALLWLPDEVSGTTAPPDGTAEEPNDLLLRPIAKPRILIADDNNDMRAYLKVLLDPHAEISVCADGEAAYEMLLRDPPDLLLSDVMMPKLDGFGLITRIRDNESLSHLPVVLLSARAGEEAKVEGLQAGADDYLVKPFAAKELLARVRRHLAIGHERKLRQQMLLERNRMQSEFLFTLAHELRNPLAPIRTGLELMRIRSDDAGADTREIQAMMRRQVNHIVHLVDDLLDVARVSEGKIELRREDVMLKQLVDDAIEISMPLIEAGRHHLSLRLPDEPISLHIDRHRIVQVLSNLVNNAAKYTPQGGDIAVEAFIDGGELAISVIDNGIGMGADMLPVVFDMYAQVHQNDNMAQGGLGVGLNLVKRLVMLHGGRVTAFSAGSGRGSRFTVFLASETRQ